MKKRTSEFFIFIFTALAFSYFSVSEAGTCTSIARTAFGANTVLTSAELNGQFDTVFNSNNAFDGGCVNSGTIEDDALNTTDFQPVLNQVQGGCLVSYTDADSLSISKCSASVNGSFLNKTTATNVDMGCTGCSAEVSTTDYYVYIKSDSAGTTLNPLILTGAPNADGYDASSNKVIARFHNNSTGDIDTYSIDQWETNKFTPQNTGEVDAGTMTIGATTTAPTADTMVENQHYFSRENSFVNMDINFVVDIGASVTAGSGSYLWTLPDGVEFPENTFNTGSSIYGTANQIYGNIYVQILVTAKVHVGNALIVPYNKTQYRIWVANAQNVDDNTLSTYNGAFVSNSVWPIGNALTIKGQFRFKNNNWQY